MTIAESPISPIELVTSQRSTVPSLLELELPTIDIGPTRRWALVDLHDLWRYRELLYFLVWRDLRVRYKQTSLGVAWVVLQPVAAALIFGVVFGMLLHVPSGDTPYPIFAFTGLLGWNYFASSLTRSGGSVVTNANLVTKVYFPRILIPLAGVINGLVDLGISLVVLAVGMVFFQISPGWGVVVLPLYVLLAFGTALGVSLWLAALNVRYRDVNYLLPFLVQVWMYATPVVYPASVVPERWQALYGLNPMTSVVEGFRWALLGNGSPSVIMLACSSVVMLVLLVTGAAFFRTTERTFADII